MRQSSRCCLSDNLGCLPCNFPLARTMAIALAVAHADEIGFELGEGGEDIEEHLSHRISRVVERPAEGQFHASFPELGGDGARIQDGPGQSVEFRHDQRVALAHGGEGLVEAGAGAGRAGEAVIGVDAILGDAKLQERLALGGQILPVGGTALVSDERCRHGGSVRIGSRFRNCFRTIHMRRSWLRFGGGRGDRLRRTLDDPLTDSAAPAGMNGERIGGTCRDEVSGPRASARPCSICPRTKPRCCAITRCPTTTSSMSGCGAEDTTVWASRTSFAPFDIRAASGGRGGHFPERPSLHCRTDRHARRRPRWLCGAGGDPEGAPRRDPAHLWLPDVLGAMRPGPEVWLKNEAEAARSNEGLARRHGQETGLRSSDERAVEQCYRDDSALAGTGISG